MLSAGYCDQIAKAPFAELDSRLPCKDPANVIIQLILSVYLRLEVITISGFYCTIIINNNEIL